jgi:lactoylglutathione lyase
MLTVSAISHVALRVKNIERSLDFYVAKLGFKEMFRLERDGKLWLMYIRVTDTQYLELFPEGKGEHPAAPDAVGYNHICLEVPDIEQSVQELAALGIPLTRPKIKAADGNWQTWIEDPDGHRIELMQLSKDGMQIEAIRRISQPA